MSLLIIKMHSCTSNGQEIVKTMNKIMLEVLES